MTSLGDGCLFEGSSALSCMCLVGWSASHWSELTTSLGAHDARYERDIPDESRTLRRQLGLQACNQMLCSGFAQGQLFLIRTFKIKLAEAV